MSDPAWKFCDASHQAVFRTWPNGRIDSVSVSAPEYLAWLAAGNSTVAADAPAPWEVRRLLIVDRLIAKGKLTAALAAISGAGATVEARWNAATVIRSDDVTARALISAVGEDPDEILAKE